MFVRASDVFLQSQDLNRIVFVKDDQKISMQEYKRDVGNFALFCQTLSDNDIILFIKDNAYLFFVCFMGILQAGKNVILPPFLAQGNLDYLKVHSHTLITDENITSSYFDIIHPTVSNNILVEDYSFRSMDECNVCFFTSGSTGLPKQIIKKFKTLSCEIENIFQTQRHLLDKKLVILASVAPYHIYGMLWRFLFPLCCGLISDVQTLFYPEELQSKQNQYDFFAFVTTPSFMDKLIKYKDLYTFHKNCLAIYSSGSLLKEETSKGIEELLDVSPFEIFGSTETGGIACRQQKDGPNWHVFNPVQIGIDSLNRLVVYSDFALEVPYQMQDAITLLDERTFLLNGRLDRLVKIAEKRISLPYMEMQYTSHKFIKDAYILLQEDAHPFLAGVFTLTDEGKVFLKNNSKKELVFLLHRYMKLFFEKSALPKRLRFVYELPTNSQGKLLKSNIQPLIDSALAEPVVENVRKENNKICMDVTFIKDSNYFSGHFDEFPILPGVVQVHFARYFFQKFFNVELNNFNLEKLKFAHVIQPHQTIRLELVCNQNKWLFSYMQNEKLYSSGIFVPKELECLNQF